MTKAPASIHIGIVQYPNVMQSAVQGLGEMFLLANDVSDEAGLAQRFCVACYDDAARAQVKGAKASALKVVLVPPGIGGDYHLNPEPELLDWITTQRDAGALICSACVGAFILARAGLLDHRPATTHWRLGDAFAERFPQVDLDIGRILIDDGDIITAAGLMSWVDLGLELVARFMRPRVMRQLGKLMIVDTGPREQRYYQRFSPRLDHGDKTILKAQHYLQAHFNEPLTLDALSARSLLTERTFLRRFVRATGLKPTLYIQRLRVQKACDLIESTNETIERVALRVGYVDVGAFRRTFNKIMGLTPGAFRRRFAGEVRGD